MNLLVIIGIYHILKGLLFLAVGLGALRLMHRDVAASAIHLINALRVDPGNFFIHHLLAKLANVDDHVLRELSIGTFFYSALSLTEGVGLILRKRWAEYFTTILTASFIPLELYEIYHHSKLIKIVILLVNIAILVYLIWELRRPRAKSDHS